MASLKKQAATSVLWSAVERFSVQGVQFLLSIVIARLLMPDDYGMIAMLTIFLAIAQTFIDGGFANALIQKKDKSEDDFCTVFYFNIGISVIAYLLLYFSAPLIATFYEVDALVEVARVAGLVLIINSFGIVQQAKLTINLEFKKLAIASLIAVTVSGTIGIWMAYSGYGVWALVFQSIGNNLFQVLGFSVMTRWLPRWRFSMESFHKLFSFGSKLLLSSLLHTIYTNLYTLVIGKKFAAVELGYFNRASTLAQFPSNNFTNVIVRAVYPIQCRIQDDDKQLYDVFLKYLRIACFLIFPIMTAFCAIAEPLIRVLLTDKWLPAVPLLQILCLAYMWDPVMKINHNMLNVKGRSDYFLYAEIWKKIVAFSILFLSIPFGVKVMCWGLVLYAFFDIYIISRYVYKLTGIRLRTQMRELMPVILLSFSMGGVMYGATLLSTNVWVQLCLAALLGGGYFVGFAFLFRYKETTLLLSLLKKIKEK